MRRAAWGLVLAVLLAGCAGHVNQASQRATASLGELAVGRSRIGDVSARFGPPQAQAAQLTANGTTTVWTYYWTRMVIASAENPIAVDMALGADAGLCEAQYRRPCRSPVIRFIFVNDVLASIERF